VVARAGRTRQGTIVNDVTQVADFLPNPAAADTQSEMAIPMVVAERSSASSTFSRITRIGFHGSRCARDDHPSRAGCCSRAECARLQRNESARDQAELVARMNASCRQANTELDIVKPLFDLAPKENLAHASLSYIQADTNNRPESVEHYSRLRG